ncbi:HupE/UreJ family protein [Pseudotenacibaculum sp. MALMAid0570]|uniref:HupE/UreJ family protein n=1 Tax=Pseudotenacibaculum sp. MALMAid0570 TaxID=3143938 RepID=UPI0032DE2CEC
MDDFRLYIELGLKHVLDFSAYDHILFLIVLAVVFSFNQWKKAIWLITFFTVGHTLTLALAAYGVINIRVEIIEFLIPVTIFITGVANVVRVNKASLGREKLNWFFALFFGLIHGLGFSNYFRLMIGKEEDKLFPLLEFALGIELSQVIIVFGILAIGAVLQNFFKVSKRDWVLVTSAIVIGFTIPMMIERVFW